MTQKEKAAMAYWDQQRRLAVQRMFRGRKVKLKILNPTLEVAGNILFIVPPLQTCAQFVHAQFVQ